MSLSDPRLDKGGTVRRISPQFAVLIGCLLLATGTAAITPTAMAADTVGGPVTWGYGYITVDSVWTDLTTDGASTWVAVGSGGKIATSKDDGKNWTIPTLPTAVAPSSFTSITYGASRWVALDDAGRILTSKDALNWSVAATTTRAWTGAAYGEGIWVVFSSATTGEYMTSKDDGVTWTEQTLPYKIAFDEVAYGNGVWAAVGTGPVERHIATTEDGTKWDLVSDAAGVWSDVEFGLGEFVALSPSGAISRSRDGRIWTAAVYALRTAASGTTWTSITAGPDGYMAVGYGKSSGGDTVGLAAYSTDAVTWTPVTIVHARWTSVQADDDGFIALGYYPLSGQTVVMRGGLVAPDSSGGFASSPWMQSIARPSAATPCPAGWAPSWAEWAFDQRGGYVCDRTIALSESHGGWMVFLGGQWWDAPDSVYVRG